VGDVVGYDTLPCGMIGAVPYNVTRYKLLFTNRDRHGDYLLTYCID